MDRPEGIAAEVRHPDDFKPGQGMQIAGMLLIGVGAIAAIISWFLPTSAYTGYPVSGDVLNIGLLQQQLMVTISGLTCAMIGALFASAGKVVQAIHIGRTPN